MDAAIENNAAEANAVNGAVNIGHIVSIRGSVIDVKFDDQLPELQTRLSVTGNNPAVLEVSA
ncbi:MAG TPA: F0F1 ATP synthase subunit beta, partial [Balneolaceae bacterium]|nr:F0F1 ATP synthase subunit beta [Balneolaceae bacterium]